MGLKDAHKTLETFWTVSVKDTEGKDVTEIQETPSCGVTEQNYITFDTVVHIQVRNKIIKCEILFVRRPALHCYSKPGMIFVIILTRKMKSSVCSM